MSIKIDLKLSTISHKNIKIHELFIKNVKIYHRFKNLKSSFNFFNEK